MDSEDLMEQYKEACLENNELKSACKEMQEELDYGK